MDDGDGHPTGEGGDNDMHLDPEEPIDEDTLIKVGQAAAAAHLTAAEAEALNITSSNEQAQNGLNAINRGLDPGTLLPPTNPPAGVGGGGSSSSSSKTEAFNQYLNVFWEAINREIPGTSAGDSEAKRKAAVDGFDQLYFAAVGEDPPSNDIDSIDGYLRDYREYNNVTAVSRTSLRLPLASGDKHAARTSEFISNLSTETWTAKDLAPQYEHVLEIAIVAHMINNPKFVAKATAHFGRSDFLTQGTKQPLETVADLAVTLKQSPNLVANVPAWFNDVKKGFFTGKYVLTDDVMNYLNESSRFQRPWIQSLAQTHENPFVRFVYSELSQTRFAKGGWGELLNTIWFQEIKVSTKPAVSSPRSAANLPASAPTVPSVPTLPNSV